MSDEKKYYCFCGSNCKYETMTKEQILAVIEQAAAGNLTFDTSAAFITKVQEQNSGGYITFWVGTQAQFNALQEVDPNCIYHITNSTRDADIAAKIATKQNQLAWVTDEDIDKMFAGTYEGTEDEDADGGGGLSITDDGAGNVTITSSGSVPITDDGNGNVAIA